MRLRNGSDSSDLVDYKASQFSRIPEMIRTYTIAREPMRGIFVLLSPRKPKYHLMVFIPIGAP
jgi:hypothetical protein